MMEPKGVDVTAVPWNQWQGWARGRGARVRAEADYRAQVLGGWQRCLENPEDRPGEHQEGGITASWPPACSVEAGSLGSQLTHGTVGMGLLGCQKSRIVTAASVGCGKGRTRQGLRSRSPEWAPAQCWLEGQG